MHITRSVEQTIKRVGLYARVSTKNHGQTPETQLVALREYVENRKFEVVHEYVDTGFSGAKDRRPQLDRLMRDAKLKKFDAVVVARFDRFARSTRHLILALEEFHSLGIDFISLNESVDTSTPMGKMVFTVIGAVAELERSLIKERVMMGLERARKQGKQLGRPKIIVDREKVIRLREEGLSLRKIAEKLGIGKDSVNAILMVSI